MRFSTVSRTYSKSEDSTSKFPLSSVKAVYKYCINAEWLTNYITDKTVVSRIVMNAVKSKVSCRSFETEITGRSFENIATLKCLGTPVSNKNCTHEETERIMISRMLPLSTESFSLYVCCSEMYN
jgi:hypothetical protein